MLLVGQQEGHSACKKTEWWGARMAICLQRGADLHTVQLTPLPLTVSCFSKIQIGFTFLVLAHPGSPGQRAVKRVCECVCLWKCACNAYLSSQFHNNVELSIHSCESLIRHVASRPMRANENVAADRHKANVLDVRMKPAVCLSIHRLRAQSCCDQIHRSTFQ